jgi:hypothetical protein
MHFRAKWIPVRVKKMRQNNNREPRSDPIGTEEAHASSFFFAAFLAGGGSSIAFFMARA